MKIEDEIKQSRFIDEYQKAHINILFTTSWLAEKSARVLKPFNISWQQFNILRILRGLSPEPASVKLLTQRMIDKMSNASRLVDKLEKKELVVREICPEDRRKVNVQITSNGLTVLKEASLRMEESLKENMGTLSPEEAKLLNQMLDSIKE